MRPAKSIAIVTVITLLTSVVLPLSVFAASEVHVSVKSNESVSITNSTDEKNSTDSFKQELDSQLQEQITEMKAQEAVAKAKILEATEKLSSRSSTQSLEISPTLTPSPTKTPTSTLSRLRIRRQRTPTPTPTLRPTRTPTPTKTVSVTNTPTPTTQGANLTDQQAYIMNAINAYRKSQGLSLVKTDPYTCNFAKTRAKEIVNGFNHDGFQSRINTDTLPYPNYSFVTENMAMTSDYKKVVTLWINSPGHAENMRRDTPYVCVESSGNYYAYEGWRP